MYNTSDNAIRGNEHIIHNVARNKRKGKLVLRNSQYCLDILLFKKLLIHSINPSYVVLFAVYFVVYFIVLFIFTFN